MKEEIRKRIDELEKQITSEEDIEKRVKLRMEKIELMKKVLKIE